MMKWNCICQGVLCGEENGLWMKEIGWSLKGN